MQHIETLKIIGMDQMRLPRMRKEPYIDLFFKLSHKAPKDWCQDFNMLFVNSEFMVKIDAEAGLYIETWVREMGEISGHLDGLKKKITQCNTSYIQKAKAAEAALISAGQTLADEPGAQEILNKVIAALDFN